MPETTKYLLIGGGVASVNAAKGIREIDKDGRIVLLSADPLMPYDRPPLSKDFLAKPEMTHDDISSKFDHWYPDNKVEVRLKATVTSIDRAKGAVELEGGGAISYGKLLLATGSKAVSLNAAVNGVPALTLRSFSDGQALRSAMEKAKSAVIVGTGYLGPEVAAQCLAKSIQTTIIGRSASIWDRFASKELGQFLNSYYREKGANLLFNDTLATVENGLAKTASGASAPADFVLYAVGAHPNTDIAKDAGLDMNKHDGGVMADLFLATSDPDIYVAGDIAHFPDEAAGRPLRHEHHLNAQWQGGVAGANMAGAQMPYENVSYFFSDFFDLHMVQRGAALPGSPTRVIGDMASGEFVELYSDQSGKLKMGVGISRDEKSLDPMSDRLEALIKSGTEISAVVESEFSGA